LGSSAIALRNASSALSFDAPLGTPELYFSDPDNTILHDGDVLSRFTVKASEIMDSLELIDQLEEKKKKDLAALLLGESPAPSGDTKQP